MPDCLFLSGFRSFRRKIALILLPVFTITLNLFPGVVQAQGVASVRQSGSMQNLLPVYAPVSLRALKIRPQQDLVFDFIVDNGTENLPATQLKKEVDRLTKYFLASLTIPEKDLWVNLSPYEHDRIVPELFGQTEMGRDLLAQDYLLKQLSASMLDPRKDLGKEFWQTVYQRMKDEAGITDIPTETFNKVWIVPEKAVVYEHNGVGVVGESYLKVMLDEDYQAMRQNGIAKGSPAQRGRVLDAVRQIILPEIEKEVNGGRSFAGLRQIYQALILAAWFKSSLKESILTKVYAGQGRIRGVDVDDKDAKEKIYQQYLAAFRQGAVNLIREEVDPQTREMVVRRYFSGGAVLSGTGDIVERKSVQRLDDIPPAVRKSFGDLAQATVVLSADKAQVIRQDKVWGAKAAQFDVFVFARQLNIFSMEKDMVLGGGSGSILPLLAPEEAPSAEDLERIYKNLNNAPVRTITSQQGDARRFDVFLRKGPAEGEARVDRVILTDGYYLEVVADRKPVALDGSEEGLREQVKLGTLLNAYVTATAEGRQGFISAFGIKNAKYYEALRSMREKGAFVFTGVLQDVEAFRQQFQQALSAVGVGEEKGVDPVDELLKGGNMFIDMNDFLIEIANENVSNGLWSYDTATKLMFLEQINVGVTSRAIVQDVASDKQARYFDLPGKNYKFGVQYNPQREFRTKTGKLEPGETHLSKSFVRRMLPLERSIFYRGQVFHYNVLPNPFPHLRNSFNFVTDEDSYRSSSFYNRDVGAVDGVPPQVPYRETIEDVLLLLAKFKPDHPGYERFRMFFNARYAGQSFDHLHYQGFYKSTVVEEVLRGDRLRLVAQESDGVQYFEPRTEDTYWMPTTLVVRGEKASDVARAVEKVLQMANPGKPTVAAAVGSDFTYNILLTYNGSAYKIFLFLRDKVIPVISPDETNAQKQFQEPSARFDAKDLPEGLMNRPATVELVDTLILDKGALKDKFEAIKANPNILSDVLSDMGNKIKYKGFRSVIDALAASAPVSAGTKDVEVDAAQQLGGIDFDPARLNLSIERTGQGVALKADPVELRRIGTDGVAGFSPVVINIVPVQPAAIFN